MSGFETGFAHHDDDRDRYAELKVDLAATHRDDRRAYTDAKSEFVRAIEQKGSPPTTSRGAPPRTERARPTTPVSGAAATPITAQGPVAADSLGDRRLRVTLGGGRLDEAACPGTPITERDLLVPRPTRSVLVRPGESRVVERDTNGPEDALREALRPRAIFRPPDRPGTTSL